MQFLADESCDFAVVRALRNAGYNVAAIVELNPGADDDVVLARARDEGRVLLTEDKDFGQLAFGAGRGMRGVVLIRFPAGVRTALGNTIVKVVAELGDRIQDAFVVVEPGRARISRPPTAHS